MDTSRWTFHQDSRIAELALEGEITVKALQDCYQRLAASPQWAPHWQILMTAGPNTRLEELTLPALRLHQSFVLGWNLRHRKMTVARTAFLCSDAVRLSIAHLWETVTRMDSAAQVAAFDDREAALDWLRPELAMPEPAPLDSALAD